MSKKASPDNPPFEYGVNSPNLIPYLWDSDECAEKLTCLITGVIRCGGQPPYIPEPIPNDIPIDMTQVPGTPGSWIATRLNWIFKFQDNVGGAGKSGIIVQDSVTSTFVFVGFSSDLTLTSWSNISSCTGPFGGFSGIGRVY